MYWERDEKRKFRVCEWVEETWEHVWDDCMRGNEERGGWERNVKESLGEEGRGEEWIKEVENVRGDKEKERGKVGLREWEERVGRKGRKDGNGSLIKT